MRGAQPGERPAMVPRAIEILDAVAIEIQADPDPALERLLADVRHELRTGGD